MDKLKSLYAKINQLNDEIPSDLAKKIHLYAEVMQLIGKYHAQATMTYGQAYAERKHVYAQALVNTPGTGVVKEGQADIDAYPYRMREAEAEGEMHRWKNSLAATSEIINALKKQLDTLMREYNAS
ncbi:hypothetical protein [Lederbergia galactosidilytica]|uniref:Uncharacterized protein n=1 Tax=Lederbergia galactosidilytica TaxID=217031 RepID=A0A177ZQ14_9BACI|nr:hypothetical protein [Lederbergia galactosidilytica]OAK70062.1 hypothetical protein ABB05_12825 [Lederbergia galactosidilytica]